LVVKKANQSQRYTWVVIHDLPAENWMIDRFTLAELRAKRAQEKGL